MSKKVIETVVIEQSDGSKIEITPYGSDFLLVIQEERPINILNDNRTTVAKAICPEYQKVEDERDKLQAFKDYVHKRLDDAGIEKNPIGEHSKAGCRIGDRLDLVFDRNAKLVEALEKVKDMQENRQKLFNHMSTEHGLTLLESEMNSIYSICIGHEEYVKYLNWLHSKPVDTKTVDAIDPTFWKRLEMFVSNIQVNDMAGEEEKQYIIHVIESKK
jgi:hypothetical protein